METALKSLKTLLEMGYVVSVVDEIIHLSKTYFYISYMFSTEKL